MAANAQAVGRSQISSDLIDIIQDNTQKLITAEDVRNMLEIYNCSKFNLIDDDIGNIRVDSNNPQTLSNFLDILSNQIQALNSVNLPLFFVDFTIIDTNPGGGDNPTRNVTLNSSNGNGVSVSILGNSVKISYDNLGFVPRITGGTEIDSSQDSCRVLILPYRNLTSHTIRVYFFRRF